ncbi:MAG: winged helix-turn-helix transcriptional regulator [Bdellovibrionales bacterium]|jgi:DNA-binding transcriptional ArsR family regulator|nr:winged helix-turn-helix transcriptional regulator [Bdellovibrionales bacterium]
MLESIFGNATVEKVLLYLQNYNEGYASEIASTFSVDLSTVQKQLKRLEDGGIIVSQTKGRTRLFLWNPRYPFRKELQSLLEKSFEFLPESDIKKFYRKRQRPRRAGKPL